VYDITSLESFADVKIWLEELRRNMSSDLVIHVVGSKSDLAADMRAVDLGYARRSVREWLAAFQEEADVEVGKDNNNGPRREEPSGGMLSLGLGFGRAGNRKSADLEREKKASQSRRKGAGVEDDLRCEIGVTEVSAKDDYGKCAKRFLRCE
jgi:hypothetical protein